MTKERTMFTEAIGELLPKTLSRIATRGTTPFLPLPWDSINNVMWGFKQGKITTISARPSQGKSTFMLQCADYLAKLGRNVMYVSIEDDRVTISERLLSQRYKINNEILQRGRFQDVKHNYKKELEELAQEEQFYIVDSFGYNIPELERIHTKTKFRNGKHADVIFYDYIQMIDNAGLEALEKFMNHIKEWALKHDVAVVIGCQQNRQAAGSVTLEGMKGAGKLEEVSDAVILLSYPYKTLSEGIGKFKEGDNKSSYDALCGERKDMVWKSYFEVDVAKNKDGATRLKIPLEFHGPYYYFRDWTGPNQIVEVHELGWKEFTVDDIMNGKRLRLGPNPLEKE